MPGLKVLRQQRMLTQHELAAAVGVTYQTVQKWESGQNRPQAGKMRRLILALNVSSDELLRAIDSLEGSDSVDSMSTTLRESPASQATASPNTESATELWATIIGMAVKNRATWSTVPSAEFAAAILTATEHTPGGEAMRKRAASRLLVDTKTQVLPFLRWFVSAAEALEPRVADTVNALLTTEPKQKSASQTPRRKRSILERIRADEQKKQERAASRDGRD